MKRSDFSYELPESLIAYFPAESRSGSRLLSVNARAPQGEQFEHLPFSACVEQLNAGDLLVLNNTKVMPARMHAKKPSGGKVEIMIETVLTERRVHAYLKSSKSPKAGSVLLLAMGDEVLEVTVIGRVEQLFVLEFAEGVSVWDVMDAVGHMPLPPYIKRDDEAFDQTRYQTVFAQHLGAVAAPTAGLHFDEAVLSQIKDKGVDIAQVTLHVGAGTFQPVRADDIADHHMHSEYVNVTQAVCDQVTATRARGGRVVAVGTTVVRCLETASAHAQKQGVSGIVPFQGETDIFIYPGYEFYCVDALITNFHLPESTLLMLVSAFAGTDVMKQAYQLAIEEEYRFYSYGDAMFIQSAVPSKQSS
ncbi:MAG: tRNA preQ1(34) S-adenosylmethionine ribosyltransferase-isomerase QueA [Pseudomonadota bacterium]